MLFFRICCARFRPKWRQLSVYLRSIQGFLQSAPQLVLQVIILAKGVHIHSLEQAVSVLSGSGYDLQALADYMAAKPLKWYWGLIQVYSIGFSFLSILQTYVQFNEWEKRRHTLHRLLLVIPFFAVTILYRALAIALLFCLAGAKLTMLPLTALVLAQVRSNDILQLFQF